MNPFLEQGGAVFFTDLIKEQLKSIKLNGSKEIDRFERSNATTRMTIRHVSESLGIKFKTKVDKTGSLWVMRVE